jgi:hypothetical protein
VTDEGRTFANAKDEEDVGVDMLIRIEFSDDSCRKARPRSRVVLSLSANGDDNRTNGLG